MEENAKLHDDAFDTGVEMAEVVATPTTTFIVAMVAAAISSNRKKNSLQTNDKLTTRVAQEECLQMRYKGLMYQLREWMRCLRIDAKRDNEN